LRLLLDTHVLLWWATDETRLPPSWRQLIGDSTNAVFVSSVSVAEIAIKASLGKLTAPKDLQADLVDEGFEELSLNFDHAAMLRDLPWHHRDPFDRMLIAQALVEGLPVATMDPHFASYGINVVSVPDSA
jgi:PIN domain nuclease of toxin-antitoxin system